MKGTYKNTVVHNETYFINSAGRLSQCKYMKSLVESTNACTYMALDYYQERCISALAPFL